MSDTLTIIRSILFPKKEICDKTELYFREESGSVKCCDNGAYLNISGTAAFDTYFNSFALMKYRQYCMIPKLFLRLRSCGSFVLRIFGVNKTDDGFEKTLLSEKKFTHQNVTEETTDLTPYLDGAYAHIYFTLTSEGGSLYGGEFLCGSDKVNNVNIAAVICTFKREKFLLHNHREICRYLENSAVLDGTNIHFYIVDNGKTLDRAEVENEHVTLIQNENTGGSGGFTRGYYEAVNSGKGFTHVLFMDDDIVLDCEMLLRVYSILRLRKPELDELSVGGTMIRLSDRVTQHEAGSVWDGKRLNSIGKDIDVTDSAAVFETAYYPEGNYNAWWFFCFPADWHEKHGYPLQLFVKLDDIEYSLRCADRIAVINGIAVWHDDFDTKYAGFQEYYIKRNELIMTSVNDQKGYSLWQARKLCASVLKQTVFQRYFLADLIFRAYKDYLKGWKHFLYTDTAALNKELMAACQPLLNDEALKEQYGVYFDEEKYKTSRTEKSHLKKQFLSLNGILLPSCFYRKDKDDFYISDLAQPRVTNFYKHRRMLHYDTAAKKGYVTKIKRRKLWKYSFLLFFKCIGFFIRYPFVRRGYKKHLAELADFEGYLDRMKNK